MATETFTTPGAGSWLCPAGVTSVRVDMLGASGGGGSGFPFALGGGGGARSILTAYSVTPGNSYDYYVGDKNALAGWYGEASWWVSPAVGNADFGWDGDDLTHACEGGAIANCVGDLKYAGGNGGNGAYHGGGGSSAGSSANGANATSSTGATAPSGGTNGSNAGLNGVAPGGGGGGLTEDATFGAAGQIVLTYTVVVATAASRNTNRRRCRR